MQQYRLYLQALHGRVDDLQLPRDGRLSQQHDRRRGLSSGPSLRAAFDPRHVEDELAGALRSFVARAGADAGLVLLLTRDPDRFMVRAPVGFDAPLILEIGEMARRASFPLTRRAIETGEPVFASGDSGRGTVYCRAGYDAWAGIPLAVGGAVAGVVHLVSRKNGFALGPAELVEAARPLGALGLSLHGLEAARSAAERGSVVEQVARGVLQHLELATLFPELIRLVARLCPCDAASVAMHRPERDGFELVAVYGPEFRDTVHEGVFVAGRETPMLEAWASSEIIRDSDARTSPYPRARQLAEVGLVSTLYIPIGRRGVFCVGHRRPYAFGEDDASLYGSIVPFLEVALRNAELLEKIRGAYRELAAAQEKLVRAERLRALGELAAGVAHDVGNVLAVVASHAELVAQRTTDAELKELVSSCLRSVEDGARAVRRVLDMARGTPPSGAPGSPGLSLEAVAREAASLTRARCRETHEVDLSGLQPVPEVPGDPGEAREAILNLILNALDATPRGGKLALATRTEEESVVSGPGVPAGLRDRVFEPFYTTKGPGHAGLGLALVARLARQSGGSARVLASRLGGARFELRFPLQEPGSGPHELPLVGARQEGRRSVAVLLVEDEPALRNALAALLALRGHTVVTAANVAEGLAALESHRELEVVVTDLGLPDRSGWELVDAVRGRNLPIIVLSGVGALMDPGKARERGVSAVLVKPTSERDLAAAIESLVK